MCPQSDMNLANQTFPSYRSDHNNVNEALATLNSGATAPPTTFANQLWIDTANNLIKQRNTGNSAWLIIGTTDKNGQIPTYAGDPTSSVTPNWAGEFLYDSSNNVYYFSTGLTNTDWVLVQSSGSTSVAFPTNYYDVKTVEYTSASVVTIKAGARVRSSDDTTDIVFSGNVTVTITIAGAGGLDTGFEAPSTWYHLYAIYNPATDTTSAVCSVTNESAAGSITLPSGYTKKRQLKVEFLNGSTSDITPFFNNNERVFFTETEAVTPYLVLDAANATSYTDVDCSSMIPPTARIGHFGAFVANAHATNIITSFMRTNGASNEGIKFVTDGDAAKYQYQVCELQTDASQLIEYNAGSSVGLMSIYVIGYTNTEVL